jgi:hypothetical protein
VRKSQIVDVLQTVYQLFEVVAGDWLLKTTSFAQNYEEIGLICGENKIGIKEPAKKDKF